MSTHDEGKMEAQEPKLLPPPLNLLQGNKWPPKLS